MTMFRYLALAGAVGLVGANAYAIHASHEARTRLAAIEGLAAGLAPPAPDSGTASADPGGLQPMARRLELLELQFREARRGGAATAPDAGLAELRLAVDDLQRSFDQLALAGDAGADVQTAPGTNEDEFDLETAEADARLAHQDRMASIGETLENEPDDPQWSRSTRSRVSDYFGRAADDGIELSGVDCRATLCKVEARIGSLDAMAKFDVEFPMQVADILPSATFQQTEHADGSVDVQIFLARAGEDLPASEPVE